ncbi:hypothetical protein [Leptospira idonii]|nr:hypothetical protein [Leptospira idonii]
MNEEQKSAIKVIKQRIITLKNEIATQKKTNEITSQSIKISKAKIAKHTSQRDLLKEKEKLSLIKDESSNAKRYLDESQAADLEKQKEETRYLTWIQKEKEDIAFLQMKEAMLSENIAELELVRAEVAVKFQESQGKVPSDPEFVKKEIFETQYSSRKSDSRRKTTEWERVKNEAAKLPKINLEDTYEESR